MNNKLMSVEEASALIKQGAFLSVAGDEAALRKLPLGNWIGGTIPYFIGDEGGVQTRRSVFVNQLEGIEASVATYDLKTLPKIARATPADGYTVLILPGFSEVHTRYAAEARDYEEMFHKPIIGWISGVHLDDLGKVKPMVVDGRNGSFHTELGVAVHVRLAAGKLGVVRILNLFSQGDGEVLTFPKAGFSADRCFVNGKEQPFAAWVKQKGLDLSLPLVANYNGAQINTSFRSVDEVNGVVHFYAPVFEDIEYRQATPVGDYVQGLAKLTEGNAASPAFACNCVLNYVYGKLEGRRTGKLTGPITFGEIAYQLLNQTLVYLEAVDG